MKSNFKTALQFTAAAFLALLLGLPYVYYTMGDTLAKLPLPLGAILTITVVQSTVISFVLSLLGILMARKVGLAFELKRFVKKDVLLALSLGLIATLVVIGFEGLVFVPNLPELHQATANPVPMWAGMLTIFQGGIFEEIMMRLFFMSLVVFLLSRFAKGAWIFWAGIFAASLVFGLGHLPAAQTMFGSLSSLMVIRILLLNGLMGIAAGYLYWKKGLQYAVIAHMVGDFLLHGMLGG